MKKWGMVLLLLVMILGAADPVRGIKPKPAGAKPGSSQSQKTKQVIWTGQSGGFEIRWTSADIQARLLTKPDRLVFSAAQLARLGFQTFTSPPNLDGSEERVTYERKFTLLSVVGSIISLKDELYYNIQPSAHPGLETRFTAIDLAKSGEAVYVSPPEADLFELDLAKLGKVAKLTDYFPEEDVLKALFNNAIIQEGLGGESPQSLAELLTLLKGLCINEISYLFPRDFLTRFAFYHLEGDKVAVRLGLPSASGAAQGLHAELGLLLPIPPALKKPLGLAASGKAGFLMQDQPKVAGDGVTVIHLSIEGKTSKK